MCPYSGINLHRMSHLLFTFAEAAVAVREHPLEPGGLLIDEGGPDHVAGDGDPSVRGAVDVAPVDLVPVECMDLNSL